MEAYKQLFNAVISELNTDYNTIENAQKIINRTVYWDEKLNFPMRKYEFSYGGGWSGIGRGYVFSCIFGEFYFDCRYNCEDKYLKLIYRISGEHYTRYRERCGIEILGMKPNRTKDGKYTYKGCNMKELKQSCKMNNIKGYSKMDKCDIVKQLMRI